MWEKACEAALLLTAWGNIHAGSPLQTPPEAGGMPHTPTRPIAFGAGPPWTGSPEEASFPVGKLPELLDPEHPSFQPDVLKLWQVGNPVENASL